MQKEQNQPNRILERVYDLTDRPGQGQKFIPVLHPFIEFNIIPDEYKDLEIKDWKYIDVTNWSAVKDRKFDFFYQNVTTLAIWDDQYGVRDGFPLIKSGLWPSEKLVPRDHVKFKTVFYYTLKYKLQLGDKIYEDVKVYDSGSTELNPKVIGKSLIRSCDDFATYIGPNKRHAF